MLLKHSTWLKISRNVCTQEKGVGGRLCFRIDLRLSQQSEGKAPDSPWDFVFRMEATQSSVHGCMQTGTEQNRQCDALRTSKGEGTIWYQSSSEVHTWGSFRILDSDLGGSSQEVAFREFSKDLPTKLSFSQLCKSGSRKIPKISEHADVAELRWGNFLPMTWPFLFLPILRSEELVTSQVDSIPP